VQIFGCSHHCELDSALVAEGFVGPFSHGSDLFDSCDTVIGDENLARYRLAYAMLHGRFFRSAHRSNDRVAIGILNEVLDSAGRSCVEVIAANEVRWKLMFRLPQTLLPVCQGPVGAVDGGRHCAGLGGDHATKKRGIKI
jgi:hypothetical protein